MCGVILFNTVCIAYLYNYFNVNLDANNTQNPNYRMQNPK